VFRYWDFALTARLFPTPARKRKLAERLENRRKHLLIKESWHKVYKVVEAYRIATAFQKIGKEQHLPQVATTSEA
jgi:hypothetical protein